MCWTISQLATNPLHIVSLGTAGPSETAASLNPNTPLIGSRGAQPCCCHHLRESGEQCAFTHDLLQHPFAVKLHTHFSNSRSWRFVCEKSAAAQAAVRDVTESCLIEGAQSTCLPVCSKSTNRFCSEALMTLIRNSTARLGHDRQCCAVMTNRFLWAVSSSENMKMLHQMDGAWKYPSLCICQSSNHWYGLLARCTGNLVCKKLIGTAEPQPQCPLQGGGPIQSPRCDRGWDPGMADF